MTEYPSTFAQQALMAASAFLAELVYGKDSPENAPRL